MTKVKIVFLTVIFVSISSTAIAQIQTRSCDQATYPEWVFYYPQLGQDAQPIVANEQSLLDPTNVRRDDPLASQLMRESMAQIIRDTGGRQLRSLAVYRDAQGRSCFIAVPVDTTPTPAAPPTIVQVSQSSSATELRTISKKEKILGAIVGYSPIGLAFINPFLALGAEFGMPFLVSKITGTGPQQPQSVVQPAQNVTPPQPSARNQKYDHDDSGSFAYLWNQ